MNNNESDETAKNTPADLKPITPAEYEREHGSLRLEGAARAYNNTPSFREALRNATVFTPFAQQESHYSDQIDAMLYASGAINKSTKPTPPGEYEATITDEPVTKWGKVWTFTFDYDAVERTTATNYAEGGIIDAPYEVVGTERSCATPPPPKLEPTDKEAQLHLHHAAVNMATATPWSYEQCYDWLKSQSFKEAFGRHVYVHYDEITSMTEDDWIKVCKRLDVVLNIVTNNEAPPKRHWSDGLERQRKHKHRHK